jgi:hypothetical protein
LQLDYVNMGKPAGYIQYLVSSIIEPSEPIIQTTQFRFPICTPI